MSTVIYAVYAAGVLAALLGFGQLSDVAGRRRTLLIGIGVSAVSAAVFLTGPGLAALLVGRILSGLSAGLVTTTATVALVEVVGPSRRQVAALTASVMSMAGLGAGPMLSGVLAAHADRPPWLPFVVDLGLLVPAVVAASLMPESAASRAAGPWRPRLPALPPSVRPVFTPVAIGAFTAFAVFGLLTAVEPALLAGPFHRPGSLLAGAVVSAMFAGSAFGQLALPTSGRRALPAGCMLLIAALGAITAAVSTTSLPLLVVGTVGVGVGQGLIFRAGLAAVATRTPDRWRTETTTCLYVVAYVAISVPVVMVGLVSLTCTLSAASIGFAVATGGLAVVALGRIVRITRADVAADAGRRTSWTR